MNGERKARFGVETDAGPKSTGAMQVFRSLAEIPLAFGPAVAAVGNFDGVHRGHRAILAAVMAEARTMGARAVAISFDPHPEQFLRPDRAPRLITPNAERLRLLAETGIDPRWCSDSMRRWRISHRVSLSSRFWLVRCGCGACTRGIISALDTELRPAWQSWTRWARS
jgi:hypothetical protein